MITLSERNFHITMGSLLLGSTILDRILESAMPAWNPPAVSLVTLVIGLVWVALFAGYRGRNMEQRMKVLDDRLERSERRIAEMDAELAQRRRPLI